MCLCIGGFASWPNVRMTRVRWWGGSNAPGSVPVSIWLTPSIRWPELRPHPKPHHLCFQWPIFCQACFHAAQIATLLDAAQSTPTD